MTVTGTLISVGIPTYNRPEGLKRTLNCITNQTYKNLEIIVSDNCSPNPEVERVVEKFLVTDPRIIYYKQKENIGAANNFKFVLAKATGEYFMWAADDDEWENNFVERCFQSIGKAGSVMCNYIARNRFTCTDIKRVIPKLSIEFNTFINARNYLSNIQPSLIYGLHKTENLEWVKSVDHNFDFSDCFFVLKQIMDYGFNTFQDYLYYAGIDSKIYIKRPLEIKNNKVFNYSTYYKKSFRIILKNNKNATLEKIVLLLLLTNSTLRNFNNHERQTRPFRIIFSKGILILTNIISIIFIGTLKRTSVRFRTYYSH